MRKRHQEGQNCTVMSGHIYERVFTTVGPIIELILVNSNPMYGKQICLCWYVAWLRSRRGESCQPLVSVLWWRACPGCFWVLGYKKEMKKLQIWPIQRFIGSNCWHLNISICWCDKFQSFNVITWIFDSVKSMKLENVNLSIWHMEKLRFHKFKVSLGQIDVIWICRLVDLTNWKVSIGQIESFVLSDDWNMKMSICRFDKLNSFQSRKLKFWWGQIIESWKCQFVDLTNWWVSISQIGRFILSNRLSDFDKLNYNRVDPAQPTFGHMIFHENINNPFWYENDDFNQ